MDDDPVETAKWDGYCLGYEQCMQDYGLPFHPSGPWQWSGCTDTGEQTTTDDE